MIFYLEKYKDRERIRNDRHFVYEERTRIMCYTRSSLITLKTASFICACFRLKENINSYIFYPFLCVVNRYSWVCVLYQWLKWPHRTRRVLKYAQTNPRLLNHLRNFFLPPAVHILAVGPAAINYSETFIKEQVEEQKKMNVIANCCDWGRERKKEKSAFWSPNSLVRN
jgi:hypothetical protein